MKCEKCNGEISGSQKFCPYCGTKIRKEEIASDPVADKRYETIEELRKDYPGVVEETRKGMNPGCLIFIIGAVILVFAIIIAEANMSWREFDRLTGLWIFVSVVLIIVSAIVYNSYKFKRNGN